MANSLKHIKEKKFSFTNALLLLSNTKPSCIILSLILCAASSEIEF